MNKNLSYTVFEGKYLSKKYYLLERSDENYEIINFDVDPKGGLKVLHTDELISKNDVTSKKILFSIAKDQEFIEVEVYSRPDLDKDEKRLYNTNKSFYDILSNDYLSSKIKYVSWDKVPIKVIPFSSIIVENSINADEDTIWYSYKILKEY